MRPELRSLIATALIGLTLTAPALARGFGVRSGVTANATVKSDLTAVRSGTAQLTSDRLTHNWSAVSTDIATLRSAEQKLATDGRAVYKAIVSDPTVKADRNIVASAFASLSKAVSQLWSDEFRNPSAVSADVSAVQAARTKVRADALSLFKEIVTTGRNATP